MTQEILHIKLKKLLKIPAQSRRYYKLHTFRARHLAYANGWWKSICFQLPALLFQELQS
jgi:superfamily II DNA helicase RecQ